MSRRRSTFCWLSKLVINNIPVAANFKMLSFTLKRSKFLLHKTQLLTQNVMSETFHFFDIAN